MTGLHRSAPQRAGIYCRLSYAPDGSLEKVERQEADCRQLAERLGWPVSEAHIFPDNSRSAWQRNRKRPQWDRMLTAIEAREIDSIIVYHGDRLIRQPYDLELLINIADQKGIRIASPSGTRDLSSPDDRFILRIEAAQACREVDNTSRRVRRAIRARVERGLTQVGGRRPYGYGVQIGTRTKTDRKTGEEIKVPAYDTNQQVPSEAKYLTDAAERLLAGQSQGGVVRWLNEDGSTTTEGNPWTQKALRNLLLSPRIAGLIEHDGTLYEAVWDGIISRETWEDLKLLYQRSAKDHPFPGQERKYLMSGVAECCFCPGGGRITTKPTGGRNRKISRIYYCSACRRLGRNVEHLDRYIEGRAVRLLNDERFIEEVHAAPEGDRTGIGTEIAALERRKVQTQKQLENLADYPNVDPGLAVKALASFDQKIAELRARMAAGSSQRLVARMLGMSPGQWADEPVDVRSATIEALFRVVLLPTAQRGPGFDPSAVRVTRRRLRGPEGA